MTLVELMVTVALGTLILLGVTSLYLFGLKSFTSMANYSELNGKSRYASDVITRDIRAASGVTGATPEKLVLHIGATDVTYDYDEDVGTLTRTYPGHTNVLLEGVKSLSFALYERPATGAAYEQFPVATASTAKLVGFRWACSRRVYGTEKSSQNVEAAIVKLRNK